MNDVLPYIDKYFNSELSNEEKKVFEGLCLSDPAFARIVAFYISLHKHTQQQWAERKKKQFAQFEVEAFSAGDTSLSSDGELEPNEHYLEEETRLSGISSNEERERGGRELPQEGPSSIGRLESESMREEAAKVRPMRNWKRLAVAASIFGVIAAGISLYLQNTKQSTAVATNSQKAGSTKNSTAADTPSTQKDITVDNKDKKAIAKQNGIKTGVEQKEEQQQLFASYFVPDVLPGDQEGPLADAFAYYEMKEYKKAANAFESADLDVETRETDDELTVFYANYYKALCYMNSGNAARAIPELRKAIAESKDSSVQSIDSSLQIKAQWYLALAYLKTGDLKKTQEFLNKIAGNNYKKDYKTKAAAILNELKKSKN